MPFSTVANIGTYALNAPASQTLPTKAVHTLTWTSTDPTAGDIFTINDGVNTAVVFELVTSAGDAPTVSGRVPVPLSGTEATMATNAKNAINSVASRGLLDVVATTNSADTIVTYYEGCSPVLATKTTAGASLTIANTTAAAAGSPGVMAKFRVVKGGKLSCKIENNIGQNKLQGIYVEASSDGTGWYATKQGAKEQSGTIDGTSYLYAAQPVSAAACDVKQNIDFTVMLRPTDKFLRILGYGPCRAELQMRGDAILELIAGQW